MSEFSNRFRQLKEESSLTLKDLSEELGISVPNLSYYMKGREPSYDILIKIADYLNTSCDYLLGRIEDDSPLTGYNIKSMNPKTYKMINNFLMLKDREKDECLWYSEAIRKRDLNQ